MKINNYDIMMELLTPAEQFNLTVLHNVEDTISRFSVKSYGPYQEKIPDGLSCPCVVGKLYQAINDIYVIRLITKSEFDEKAIIAEDAYVPTNSILMFMGIERFQFEKSIYDDSFSVYALKYLIDDKLYYDLIPTRFNYDGFDWTDGTQQNIQHIMQKMLKSKLLLLET